MESMDAYKIWIDWAPSQPQPERMSAHKGMLAYDDLAMAVKGLLHLKEADFNPQPGQQPEKSWYIEQATLKQSSTDQELLSRVFIGTEHAQMKPGTYLRVHLDNIDTQTLKAIQPHIEVMESASSMKYMICRLQAPARKPIQRFVEPALRTSSKQHL